jgi:hypothetical protein
LLLLEYQRSKIRKVKEYSRIILVLLAIVLVIHVLNILLGVVLGLLPVDEIHALGLGQLVNLSTSETDKHLLGKLMGDGLA